MSAPAQIMDGRFYAPIGVLAEGLDGEATYDSAQDAVTLKFDGQSRTLPLN